MQQTVKQGIGLLWIVMVFALGACAPTAPSATSAPTVATVASIAATTAPVTTIAPSAAPSATRVATTVATSVPTSSANATPIGDAAAMRDALLAAAQTGGWEREGDPLDLQFYPAWTQRFPNLKLVGYAVAADATRVSVFRGLLNSKNAPSATNPKVIAFAVADESKRCAGGVLKGYPQFTSFDPVALDAQACTAAAVLDKLRK